LKKRTAIDRRFVETQHPAISIPQSEFEIIPLPVTVMLALRRSSTIAAAYLRSFSTETSKVCINDVFPPPRPTSSTSFDKPFYQKLIDGPPTGKAYPKTLSFPGSTKVDIPKYRLHCKSSHNNIIVTFTDNVGKPIAWQSGGRCEFKGCNRASYEAGYQSAVRIFRIIEQLANQKDFSVALFLNGFGQGREAFKTALLAIEGLHIRSLICSVTDRTPIKIGGTRSKKTRRL
jgi:small subunit ribosomal protein S11